MFHLLSPRQQLVQIMNRIYYGGMTTLSGGNLSIRDADGTIWITPSGVDKGRLSPNDINCILPDGSVTGPHQPSSELPFHRAIYARRPDVSAVIHAHAPALVSFSIVRKIPDTGIIPQARQVCGRVGYAPYALPGSEMLGERIAEAFSEGYDAVLLENHGAVTVGNSLLEGFQRLETLDFCARTQMYAQGLGNMQTLTDEQLQLLNHKEHLLPEFTPSAHGSLERELREKVVDTVRRACQRQLMISTEGVVSARVDDSSFLITPTGIDRPSVEVDSLVLIQDGKREAGKVPSRSVRLHDAIYRRHPHVQSIITAQAPFIAAYAVVDQPLDTKTIPESYILLMAVPKVPFGSQYTDPAMVAETLSRQSPVIILQNEGVLVTGSSMMQAFDRLEVAEFTARSLVETSSIGKLVSIGPDEVRDLERAFAHLMR
ncbi:MAG: class II aldolase/adducin family protein [Anaerolineae bacterium]|nr:class II aldolase/adducin family protein [Anaerolineae bacterium]